MKEPRRNFGQVLLHGLYGAFLAALLAVPVYLWWIEISWPVLGGFAVLGFLMGALFAEEAIGFLKEMLRWFWW